MQGNKFEMVAKTFQGLEDVLRDELIDLGAANVEIGTRMVTFEGDLAMLYKANLCCRTAIRILKPIVKFTADSTDDLYDQVRELDWSQFLTPDTTFSIDSTVYGDEFTHSKFVTYRVKDGIVDHFTDKFGKRPSIRLTGADIQFNVHIAGNRVTISLDSSGEPLFKRGYRVEQTEAPINEVLAAGIILKTGWRGETDFLDPMCGSGTFLIEAALIACNINPGIYRQEFAFEKWTDFDKDLFEEIYNDDSREKDFNYKIFGGDIDADAIAIARKNVKSARLEDYIELSRQDLTDWQADTPEGIIVTNPPYGERLRPDNINNLYKSLGTTLKNNFQGWHAWVIGYHDEQMKEIGLKPSVKFQLHNGSLECSLREYVMFDGKYSEFRADGGTVSSFASEKKHAEGPKKVRRISDDDWESESRKFNKGKSLSSGRSPKNGRRDRDNDRKGFRDNDRDGFRKKDRFRDNDRDGFRKKDKFRDNDRDGFRKKDKFRDNDRDGFRKNDRFRDNDRDGFRKKDRFRDKKKFQGPSTTYNPANSKGPRLPESSATIINEVHIRKRKPKDLSSSED